MKLLANGRRLGRKPVPSDSHATFFTVSVLDRRGSIVPTVDNLVHFAVRGAGHLKGSATATRLA
ncbi:hypothetical protein [Sphingomonas bacterium]|uniref:hypothetical protein n=1 Tax=Sphingomonas bacterium TaxID=1895847 RepID=UPI001575ECF5|nr:hypothetical protein [Sphingomonas bacterium]